ncbi:hypothetical protein [Amycolatopsis sp. NPDC051102]|uniref:hypothetical protein n=1 Tax=Amycolatopsis sp. NPDC051102 TaxID=3155163 RepID=UPI00343671D5
MTSVGTAALPAGSYVDASADAGVMVSSTHTAPDATTTEGKNFNSSPPRVRSYC